ncbi:MAG: AAA family ATPase [Lawsonibacter sp.]|nr:AAA family ATPase [Lawsonibacter sp.]
MTTVIEPVDAANRHRLNAIDGETLMTTPLPPIRFTINGLLPQGLHILAGAPKVGKSWLALWLCLCVAKGETVWEFPSMRGDVLYLCLEDSYSRIQNRLLDITDDAPDNLFFATMAEKLRGGLEQQIERFLAEHPGTVLIVIDTLQRIRGVTNDVSPYANDYRDLGILKELADRHRIAILLIHHLRKMNDDDPMNMISGTTGISGATDSNFVLLKDKRGGNTATLYCTGRDIEYRELTLEFDTETHIWKLLSDSVTTEPQPQDELIVFLSEFLSECKSFTGTATELAEMLEKRSGEPLIPAALTKRLIRYRDELTVRGITFETHRTRDRRELRLRILDPSASPAQWVAFGEEEQ